MSIAGKKKQTTGGVRRSDHPNEDVTPKSWRARLIVVCGAFAGVVVSLAAVSIVSMELLSAARGYTQGEALWSKGQKDAVLYLMRYARTRSDIDYQRFRESIEIPLACRTARQQMDLAVTDDTVLRNAFARAGIHTKDRRRMVLLYRHLKKERHLADAVAVWMEAESEILELERNGERLRAQVLSPAPDVPVLDEILAENDRINSRLTPLEARFSQSLADAGRWLHSFLITMLSALSAALIATGCAVYYFLFSRITNSEQKYRHLIDTASEAILIADACTGRIVDVNRKATEMLDSSVIAPHGSLLSLLYPEWRREGGSPSQADINLIGEKREARLRSAIGSEIDVEFSGSVVDVRRRPLIELIIRDVSHEKQAAQAIRESEQRYRRLSDELRIARDRALDAAGMKSRFLANMSHEIRTPMNGVMGMLNLALECASDPVQKEQLEVAQDAAQAMLTILNDILDLSKVEAGKMNIEAIDFDLHEACEQVIRIFATAAREKGLHLGLSIQPNTPRCVRGDPIRLRQVLVNLIGNAIKFTDLGSVDVRVFGSEGGIRFEVEDTGIGISKEKLEAIFEAFAQADGSHTRQYGGTGLGLTITKRLVELMNGRVWVESREGSGSCFYVQMPLHSRTAPEVSSSTWLKPGPEFKIPKLHILVAEDNRVNQKVLSAFLRKWGWTFTLASNGKDAYDQFLNGQFDLVLMDVQMPEMDGFEAAHMIREAEKTKAGSPHIPVVAVTAHATKQHHDQCIQAGMDAVVTKPVDPAALLNVIRKAVRLNPDTGTVVLTPYRAELPVSSPAD